MPAGAWATNDLNFPPLRHTEPQDWLNVVPRLGFAYTLPGNRTVLRGGFGKYYIGPKDQWSHQSRLYPILAIPSTPNDGRPDFASNPYNGAQPTFEQASLVRRDGTGTMTTDGVHTPYSWQSSMGFQRQLGETMSVQADYVFTGGRREESNRMSNLSFDPATGLNYPFSDISRRPFPDWGRVTMKFSDGRSNYNGLETAFTKRFSNHWQGSATYTLSQFSDLDPSPVGFAFPLAPDLGGQYGLAVGDQRHRAVFNGIVSLPYDLQLSGLYFFGSGQRFTTNYGADFRDSGAYSNRVRPNGTIAPRNNLVGQPIHRVDLRARKKIRIHARSSVEGSFEVFNLFNHANYGSYVTAESNALFGRPQQNPNVAYQPRMLQLGFRLTF